MRRRRNNRNNKNGVVFILASIVIIGLMFTGIFNQYQQNSDTKDNSYNQHTNNNPNIESTLEIAFVERVIDGDTIVLRTGERVRFIGLDAPEMGPRGSIEGAEPGALEAKAFVEDLILHQYVWLEPDGSNTDRFDRLRRYVWMQEIDDPTDRDNIINYQLNAWLLIHGHAEVMILGNVRNEALFRELAGD